MSKSVSIVVPAYNEEKNLALTVESLILPKLAANQISDFEIIIFNDASLDRTGEIADELARKYSSIRVVHNPRNMNLGYNVVQGFQLAQKEYAGWVSGDAFEENQPENLDVIFQALGQADLIISYFINPEARSWTRRFLSRTYTEIINLAFGQQLHYYNGSCYFRTALVKKVPVETYGFAYMTEILIKLLKSGTPFVEVPLVWKQWERGRVVKAFRLKNIASVFKTFLKLFWEIQVLRRRIPF